MKELSRFCKLKSQCLINVPVACTESYFSILICFIVKKYYVFVKLIKYILLDSGNYFQRACIWLPFRHIEYCYLVLVPTLQDENH
jgi:hypothetical protein